MLTENEKLDAAKALLMETKGFTEPQAHRYIYKRAMDTRVKKAAVAQEIINTYGRKR